VREAAVSYDQIAWLPLTAGLTGIGLVASWLAWRRRGVAAGLRGAAWSLLPVAAYLTGVLQLLWRFGSAIGSFASSFVFSPRVWSGVVVAGVALVLFVVSGGLRRGRDKKQAGQARPDPAVSGSRPPAAGLPAPAAAQPVAAGRRGRKGGADDDDLSEVEQILRRRGIK
jgi:hypothetical protein